MILAAEAFLWPKFAEFGFLDRLIFRSSIFDYPSKGQYIDEKGAMRSLRFCDLARAGSCITTGNKYPYGVDPSGSGPKTPYYGCNSFKGYKKPSFFSSNLVFEVHSVSGQADVLRNSVSFETDFKLIGFDGLERGLYNHETLINAYDYLQPNESIFLGCYFGSIIRVITYRRGWLWKPQTDGLVGNYRKVEIDVFSERGGIVRIGRISAGGFNDYVPAAALNGQTFAVKAVNDAGTSILFSEGGAVLNSGKTEIDLLLGHASGTRRYFLRLDFSFEMPYDL